MNMFIGGTMDSYDYSWFRSNYGSCVGEQGLYQSTFDLGRPDLNYYITVTGDTVLGTFDLSAENFTMHPNPATDTLNITLPKHVEALEYKIYTITGQIIVNETFEDRIDISSLVKGVYFLNISSTQS